MSLILIKNYQFLLAGVLLFTSCADVNNKNTLTRKDSVEILELAFNSVDYKKIYREFLDQNKDSTIYFVLDSTNIKIEPNWPRTISNSPVKFLKNFNRKRNFIEQSHDKRYTLQEPTIALKGDTAYFETYSYPFFMNYSCKFIRKDNKWILIDQKIAIE